MGSGEAMEHEEGLRDAELALLGAAVVNGGRGIDELDFDPSDFLSPVLEHVWLTMARMLQDGKPVDQVSLWGELESGSMRVSPTLVHEAVDAAPAESAMWRYAGIVAEAAARRRLKQAGLLITELADKPGEVDALIEESRRKLDDYGKVTRSEPVLFAYETMEGTLDRLDSADPFTPTPWAGLNDIIGGFRPGGLYTIGARPGVGKALALDTPLPTPTGWTTMGEVRPGDQVLGADGRPTTVVAETQVWENRPCYRVTFDDGTTIVADEEHEWFTSTRASRKFETAQKHGKFNRNSPYSRDQRAGAAMPGIVTTVQMFATQRVGSDNRPNHATPLAKPLEMPHTDLMIDPYVLGVWLGDGTSRYPIITSADQQIVDEVRAAGYPCRPLKTRLQYSLAGDEKGVFINLLRELGIYRNKHIPQAYLRASFEQRLALMQGLIDTDGTVSASSGRVSFEVTSRALAHGAYELAVSLGLNPRMRTRRVKGRTEESSTCYRVGFITDLPVARLQRKLDRLPKATRLNHRMVVAVERVESVPVKCIEVDNESHLYLASRAMIPTHNSVMGIQVAEALAQHGSVAMLSLEMSQDDVNKRLLAHQKHIPMERLTNPKTLTHADYAAMGEWLETNRLPIAVHKGAQVTITDIRRFSRNVHRRVPLAGVIVDYLQLMAQAPNDKRGRQEFVADMSRGLKLLAIDMNVPVVMLSQLNRGSSQRDDKRPVITDLRESGAIEQDSDVVILLHRDTMDPELAHLLEMSVAKNRHGRPGVVDLEFAGHYSEIR